MGWGTAILVKGTGSVWVYIKWPSFILSMFPTKTMFTFRKYF